MSVDKCKINLAFIKGEKSHEVDEVFWQKNGKAIPVEYFSYPQYKENKIVGAVVTFTDISERLEAEKLLKESEEKYRMQSEILTKFNKEYLSINEELKRYVEEIQTLNDTLANQNNELHELNATKDKFLSILAHDLKNPFNILIGFSSLLVKNALKYQPEKIQEFSKTINDVSVNSYALLENLLEWSKLQTGKLVPNPVNIDLAELISEVSQFTDHMSKAKNIQFLLDMSCTTQIWADKEMIKTVLRNLLTNALKFTKPGGNVSLMTRCQEKAVLIEVADTGIGIEAKHLDNLFKIDSKLSRTGTADEKGTGLGLILCKEFVEINNGEIWVESEIDMGSTFKFTVPLFQMEN
jgi:signal transduction histidine kinase